MQTRLAVYFSQTSGFTASQGVIGQGVGKVFFQQASVVKDDSDKLKTLFFSTTKKLALIGIIPSVTLLLFGGQLFSMFFGKTWEMTGNLAQVMSLWLFFLFILSPITHLYSILNKLKISVVFQVVYLLIRSIILISLPLFNINLFYTILVLSIVNMILNA